MLQCVAACCSVLQCIAVCCSVFHCVAACCSVLQSVAVFCSVLQCVAVCCSVLQRVAMCQLSNKHVPLTACDPHPGTEGGAGGGNGVGVRGEGGGHGPKIFDGTALDYSPEFVLAIYKLQNTFREKRGINTLVPPASLAHTPAHASLPLAVPTEETIPTHLARVRFVGVRGCVCESVREVCVCMSVHTYSCTHKYIYIYTCTCTYIYLTPPRMHYHLLLCRQMKLPTRLARVRYVCL